MDPHSILFLQSFDQAILQCFLGIIGAQNVTQDTIAQIRLPERLSGLGLLSGLDMSSPAFLGSSRQAIFELNQRRALTEVIHQTFNDSNLSSEIQWHRELRLSWERYRGELNNMFENNNTPEWSNEVFMAMQPMRLQHRLFSALVENKQKTLMNSSSPQDKIRILSCSAVGSAAFLRAPAYLQGCMFSNEELKIAIKTRINAPLNLLCPPRCACGSVLEDNGDHLFKCRIGPEWENRHSTLVHTMASILRSVNFIVQHEVPLSSLGPLRDLDDTGDGRMDLVVASGDSTPILADVTVIHPIPSRPIPAGSQMTTPLYFAKYRENAKTTRYGDRATQIHHAFIPMVFETFGAFGPQLNQFLKSIAGRALHGSAQTYRTQLIRFWRVRLSACLQRANARLILSKANRIRSRSRQGPYPNPPPFQIESSII